MLQRLSTLGAFVLLFFSSYAQCDLTVTAVITSNSCNAQNCVYAQVAGGTAPFTYELSNGQTLSGNAYACLDIAGDYVVYVTDAEGCTAEATFTVSFSDDANLTCETALALENGVAITDTICNLEFETNPCINFNYYQSGWYSINSENYSHLQIGAMTGYYSTPGIVNNVGFEIFAAGPGQDCSTMSSVYCGTQNECFDLADYITLEANTTYYIHVMALYTSWVPTEIVAVLSNEPVASVCGCTNPLSCNYDPDALVDDGSCGYNGCTDLGACNYLSYASCDDGSCVYSNDFTGVVFHDINGNNIRDTYPTIEPTIGNVGHLHIEELNIDIYPNQDGEFILPSLEAAQYTVTYIDNSNTWMLDGESITLTLPTCNGLMLPLVPVSGATAQVYASGFFNNSVLGCVNGSNFGVWISNTGTVPISGSASLTIDASLTVSPLSYATSYNTFENGVATWNTTILPGQWAYLGIHINGPGVEFVGDTYDFSYSLELMDDQELPFYSYNGSNTLTVSCSYDPNDKQATPAGYAEPHYILADTEIEYKIRFQNTGNASAFNVHIDDQLDLSKLDLSTFEPVAASHSYYTIVNPDGFVQFVFDNIMLPDSASDEPGSQGFVIYKIRPYTDITPESVIENTAYIYFDENPAVITNTTYHTIYHCDMMPQSTEDLSACEGESFSLSTTYPYVESVQWLVNNEVVSDEPELIVPSSQGSYFIQMILTNPLCSSTSSYYYNVYGAPEITISSEAGTITAEGADTYVWYINDSVLEGETDGVIENAQPGYYVAQGTTAFGCTGTSDVFMYVGVEETATTVFNLYPNPAANSVYVMANNALGQMISITDASGRLIRSEKINTSNMSMDVSDLADGLYFVRIGAEQRLLAVKK